MTTKTITTTKIYCDLCDKEILHNSIKEANLDIKDGWKLDLKITLSKLNDPDEDGHQTSKIGDICEKCLSQALIEII